MDDFTIQVSIQPTESFLNSVQSIISEGLEFANNLFNQNNLNFLNPDYIIDSTFNPLFEQILQQSTENNQLSRDDTKKICLKSIPLKKKTVEMKQYLRDKNVCYKHCKNKPELIILYEKILKEKKEDVECSICKETINISDNIYKLTCCKNMIHSSCLDEWVKYKMDCPLCRGKLPELIS